MDGWMDGAGEQKGREREGRETERASERAERSPLRPADLPRPTHDEKTTIIAASPQYAFCMMWPWKWFQSLTLTSMLRGGAGHGKI